MPSIRWTGPDEGCPDMWETCLSSEDADELLLWLRAMRRHVDEIRALCGTQDRESALLRDQDPTMPL